MGKFADVLATLGAEDRAALAPFVQEHEAAAADARVLRAAAAAPEATEAERAEFLAAADEADRQAAAPLRAIAKWAGDRAELRAAVERRFPTLRRKAG